MLVGERRRIARIRDPWDIDADEMGARRLRAVVDERYDLAPEVVEIDAIYHR
jgi:hypothetical protein